MNYITKAVMLACLLAAPAQAQDCKPLQLIDTIKMTTMENDGRRTVPVMVNTTPETFLIDTGGFMSGLTTEGAAKANLHVQKSGSIRVYTVDGNSSTQSAAVEEFMVGRLKFTRNRLFLLPNGARNRPFDGLLAANMMFGYEIELNFADNTMKYFLKDHCPGKVIYWDTPAVGVVPIILRDNSYIEVEVTLEDKSFEAIIDTGATDTFMTAQVAKNYFGLFGPAPGDKILEGGDTDSPTYLHTFKTLSFGDITVTNARVIIYPDKTRDKDRTQQTGNRALRDTDNLERANLLIGMNILEKLHIFMSFGERRFYVTPAIASQPASK